MMMVKFPAVVSSSPNAYPKSYPHACVHFYGNEPKCVYHHLLVYTFRLITIEMHTCISRQQQDLVYTLGEEVPKLVYTFLMCKPVRLEAALPGLGIDIVAMLD